jgi:hypothetical protein
MRFYTQGGLMVAKARRDWHVTLTDLPRLMSLLERNVKINFAPIRFDETQDDDDPILRDYLLTRYAETSCFASDLSSRISARVLEWSEIVDEADGQRQSVFDVIIAADVVASIYDPIALACTIHRLAHTESTVCLSFKERLSSVHRQFEQKLASLFETVQVLPPSAHASRNRNADVRILMARSKK